MEEFLGELDENYLESLREKIKGRVSNCRLRIKNVSKRGRSAVIFVKKHTRSNTIIFTLRVNDKQMADCLSIGFLCKKMIEWGIKDCFLSFEVKK